jgi:hypothetical protein
MAGHRAGNPTSSQMQVRDNRVDRKNITAARIKNDGSFGKEAIEISSVAEAGAVFAD